MLLRYQEVLLIGSLLIRLTHIQLPTTRAELVKKPIHLLPSQLFPFRPKFSSPSFSLPVSHQISQGRIEARFSSLVVCFGSFLVLKRTSFDRSCTSPTTPGFYTGLLVLTEVEKVIRLSKAALQLPNRFSTTCGLRYWRFGRLVHR